MVSHPTIAPRRPRSNRNFRSSVSTLALLMPLSAAGMLIAGSAAAACGDRVESAGSYSCALTSDYGNFAYGYWASVDSGVRYALSSTGDRVMDTSSGLTNYALYLDLNGKAGSSSVPNGSSGADVTVNNASRLELVGLGNGKGENADLGGIFVRNSGGAGAKPKKTGDGGRGGNTGTIGITNNAAIIIAASAMDGRTAKAYGINARASSGAGGVFNTGVGNQKGGDGGTARKIEITNTAAIQLGDSSTSIRAANAGRAINAESFGNSGGNENGNGGRGGVIDINNSGALGVYYQEIGTASEGVHGILGKSIGGSGSASKDNSDEGGSGAAGGQILIQNRADITIATSGNAIPGESAGILALSRGGDGGTSPNRNTGGVGGNAGVDENNASAVTTLGHLGGLIKTNGDNMRGIVARSEGGRGGNGNGDSKSRAGNGGTGGSIQVNLENGAGIETYGRDGYGVLAQSVGGLGGSNAKTAGRGGDAGNVGVYATQGTSIKTKSDYSAGLTFHSLGGGGGTGGDFVRVLAGAGGDGGDGGNAKKVTLTTGAAITTQGNHSFGVLGQSIGGGGGTGGIGAGLEIGLGGDGGGGGTAANVEINNTGVIQTAGNYSTGILAQSLSGGGGAAGAAGGLLSVGGSAGIGHNSATAQVTSSGAITTTGNGAAGIIVQSVGGGGGNGGGAAGMFAVGGKGNVGGNGGTANAFVVDGTVSTSGGHSYGLVAQSIGGGGGNGGDVLDISVGAGLGVGGSGSGGGTGGYACATNYYGSCQPDITDASKAPQGGGNTIKTSGEFSHGMLVQSIGGGGGNGGSVAGASVVSALSLQIGGSAGSGVGSGAAFVNFKNLTLGTSGNNAKGIISQSIGGGGGNGGNAVSASGLSPVSMQIGGSGGTGASTGTGPTNLLADITLAGSRVTTRGANAGALLVQSIGGGGGTGGSAAGYAASVGLTIETALGGSGAGGGNSAIARARVSDTVITTGIDDDGAPESEAGASSHGISVQSIAGGGGTGGSSTAEALTVAAPTGEGESFAITSTVALGGAPGAGGIAGNAEVDLNGASVVRTGGDGAHGALVQSIGGGGGDGGSASTLSGTIGISNTVGVTLGTSIGAEGGSGGKGGAALVNMKDTAKVETFGDGANALLIQSVGGGGGDGGIGNADSKQIGGGTTVAIDIGLGGGGGSGGTGGETKATLDGGTKLVTHGSGARGIIAQSIGGGGGTGQGGTVSVAAGFSVGGGSGSVPEGEEPVKTSVSINTRLDVGARGGSGNSGGAVNATVYGDVTTFGGDADGVLLQSIGGGGGLAGSAGADTGTASNGDNDADASVSLSAAIGGKGGSGGHGGGVKVSLNAPITTKGDWSDAFVAQSIGGGGGIGGTAAASNTPAVATVALALGGSGGAGGDGGAVEATLLGNDYRMSLNTEGYGAHGALLQSIGGGGGQASDGSTNSGGRITVGGGMGGSGGAAGNGGSVTINPYSFSFVTTKGDDAYGLMAQSIGGGGGIAGNGSSVQSDKLLDLNYEIAVGGSGGATGNGGAVSIDTGINMTTSGARSFGILAQSIGGGGGVGGTGDTDSHASIRVGGGAGASGNGGSVKVRLASGALTTAGKGAHGIIAQSIGGGGGIAGDLSGEELAISTLLAPDNSNADAPGGNGGGVDVVADANILTTGDAAYGIIAQSIGGGGGLYGKDGVLYAGNFGDMKDTISSAVNITQSESITVNGKNSIGIFAQSIAFSNSGKISVAVNGNVRGGTDKGAGVYISEGSGNVLDIAAGASVMAGGSAEAGNRGLAVSYFSNYDARSESELTINNAGRLVGDVSLKNADGDAAGTVNNLSGGTFETGALVGASVVNTGALVLAATPPAAPAAARAAPPAATTRILGDFTQGIDGRLIAPVDFETGTGSQLVVAGASDLRGWIVPNVLSLLPGGDIAVFRGEGVVRGEFKVKDAPAVDFELNRVGDTTRLSVNKTRFGAAFGTLNANQRAVGRHLDGIFQSGTREYGAALGAISNLSAEKGRLAYSEALSSLTPGGAQGIAAAQVALSQARMGSVMACRNGKNVISLGDPGSCGWLQADATRIDQDGTGGYDGTQYGIGGGVRFRFGDDWAAGFAAGIGQGDYDSDSGQSSAEGTSGYVVAGLGRSFDRLEISGALMASYGDYDLTRLTAIPGFQRAATGDTDVLTYGARVRAAYTFGSDAGYVRPAFDLAVIHTDVSGYTETGAGLFDLTVGSQAQTSFAATPSIEFGGNMKLQNGWNLDGYANVGVSFLSDDDWTVSAGFAGAPGAGRFSSSVPIPDRVGNIGLGVILSDTAGFQAQVEYGGSFGKDFNSHSLSLELSKKF
ncbi:autotransporter outer membrane beta-barrel domain-containing protein [Roseovarius dicentrarchi]|uniref:autotransporter outer membrane beta-barrel domain-containing protein n=1 Tax=Roseovarius dicentrarchi TaxID=2250573 RepID=UPI0013966AA2|nr:autotransporter outer membrane beta-barrel domain-containing protein [Roseovarius dicentrarchi]